jgi:hypothetical protein
LPEQSAVGHGIIISVRQLLKGEKLLRQAAVRDMGKTQPSRVRNE